MKISIAQLRPIKGEIVANIEKHKSLIALAVSEQADAVFFPELSISSYEPELAKDLATTQDDPRFDIFQQISDTHRILVGVGVPTISDAGIRISMLIFQPKQPRLTYSKQQLHADELPYFVKGDQQLIVSIQNCKIAPAICYESLQPDHSKQAAELGAEIYLAGVAKSQKGVDKARIHYPNVAQMYAMPVLMANALGFCDNFESAGQSAVWNKKGELIAQLDEKSEGIIVFDVVTGEAGIREV